MLQDDTKKQSPAHRQHTRHRIWAMLLRVVDCGLAKRRAWAWAAQTLPVQTPRKTWIWREEEAVVVVVVG